MIKFSFLPLKKLSTAHIEEHRFDIEEVISLNSVEELKLLLGMFGAALSANELNNIADVSQVWTIDKKLKPQNEATIDSFYNQWLAKSKRENDFGEFCQLVSFNSFITALNKGKFKVVMELADHQFKLVKRTLQKEFLMSSIPRDKHQLLDAINTIFPKLMADYRTVPVELARLCTIEGNLKGTVISVSDTVAYLIGWGKLVLKWHQLTSENQNVDFPETGFKWNQLGLLAQHFQHHYRDFSYPVLLNELDITVNQLSELINSLSNDELYGADWYDTYTLGRMIQLNTSSPMKNMRTKVRRFIREQC